MRFRNILQGVRVAAVLLAAGLVAAGATELPNLAPADAAGSPLIVRGRVVDAEGRPVAGAVIVAYHTDSDGRYHDDAYRGELRSDEEGSYGFLTIRPGGYGPTPHIHFEVTKDGRRTRPTLRLRDAEVREVEHGGRTIEQIVYDIELR